MGGKVPLNKLAWGYLGVVLSEVLRTLDVLAVQSDTKDLLFFVVCSFPFLLSQEVPVLFGFFARKGLMLLALPLVKVTLSASGSSVLALCPN